MGADMILAMVEYPEDFDQVRRRIDRLDNVDLYDLGLQLWNWEKEDYEDPEQHWITADEVRKFLHEALDLLASPPRDISTHEVEGKEYAFTGGPSLGVGPTESYQHILALQIAEVCYTQDPLGQRK